MLWETDDSPSLEETDNSHANNKSPIFVGTSEYACSKNSLWQLLKGQREIVYIFRYASNKPCRFPSMGVSSLPILNLFWEVVKNDGKLEKTPEVWLHHWAKEDHYFDGIELDDEDLLKITFFVDPANSSKIMTRFSHMDRVSKDYEIMLASGYSDGYLVFSTSWKYFQAGRFSLLTEPDCQEILAMEKADAESSKNIVIRECAVCGHNCEIIYSPCGHTMFCTLCDKRYVQIGCPSCKFECVERITIKKLPQSCTLCPNSMPCKMFNSILIPCGHVLGCLRSAERGILPGIDNCPDLKCGAVVESIMKIYLQETKH